MACFTDTLDWVCGDDEAVIVADACIAQCGDMKGKHRVIEDIVATDVEENRDTAESHEEEKNANVPGNQSLVVHHVDEKSKAETRTKELEELRLRNIAKLNAASLDSADVPKDAALFLEKQRAIGQEQRMHERIAKENLHAYRADEKHLMDGLKKSSPSKWSNLQSVQASLSTPEFCKMVEMDQHFKDQQDVASWRSERVRSFDDAPSRAYVEELRVDSNDHDNEIRQYHSMDEMNISEVKETKSEDRGSPPRTPDKIESERPESSEDGLIPTNNELQLDMTCNSSDGTPVTGISEKSATERYTESEQLEKGRGVASGRVSKLPQSPTTPSSKSESRKEFGDGTCATPTAMSPASQGSSGRKSLIVTPRVHTRGMQLSPSSHTGSEGRSPCRILELEEASPELKVVPLYARSKKQGPICTHKYIPNLHKTRDGCERCLYWASAEDVAKFHADGHHLRIMKVRGGCDRGCVVFPRQSDEFPVRLCKKCFFDTHKGGKETGEKRI